jgi:hypothetical protein
MRTVWRIFAVARTEFRFGLRRGWPVVGTVAVGVSVSLGVLYLGLMNLEGWSRDDAPEVGASALAMVWPVFQWLALGVMPIVAAPSIPSDRQFGVDELLHSTPLTGGAYLAGKVLGVEAAVLLTGAVIATLHLVLHWMLIGSFNLGLYVEIILLNGLPLLVWASAIGVLGAAGMRTRRAAIFIGILIGFASPYPWALTFRPPADMGPFQGTASLLSRQVASDFVFQRYQLLPDWVQPVSVNMVLQVYAMALLILLGVAALSRLWLAWKENF